jgi:hypothetical protein
VKLLETVDGFYQRMRRHFGMTDREGEEPMRIFKRGEDVREGDEQLDGH